MRRWITMILAVVMVLGLMVGLVPKTQAESLYIRKIVSVVYDDSGSMRGDNWAYANYALQAFCGMLNSEDQLYVTYMSDCTGGSGLLDWLTGGGNKTQQLDLSGSGIQGSVDSIRNHTNTSGTPYEAVEVAFDKLKKVDDSNPNTQYWLVVITDGVFDEFQNGSTADEITRELTKRMENVVTQTMPNGTAPQVTFMSIGDVPAPTENVSKGIYTFNAANANDVTNAMNNMADRISGRTRLAPGDIRQVNDKTISVSSAVPLLNIALFAQESGAKVTGAVANGEGSIPVSRSVSLEAPVNGMTGGGHPTLNAGAYLLGDSQRVIGSGEYKITFDQPVDASDLVVLLEPALEMRMTISLNGQPISDLSQLDNTMESDKISVSCKVYEMGTDKVVDPSLLPADTGYTITLYENGNQIAQSSGADMQLQEQELHNIDTKITATLEIKGFSPIVKTVEFTPGVFVPQTVYTIQADYTGDKSIKYDDLGGNTDMQIAFTVLADGVVMTDKAAVEALAPNVTSNGLGAVTVEDDGRILYTPNGATVPGGVKDSFPVDVTCTLNNGVSATLSYTVLLSSYQIVPVNGQSPVYKTNLFDNDVGVSFTILKDGVQLGKADVEQGISAILDDAHATLQTSISVDADGTIHIVPYGGKEVEETFGTWLVHWWDYFFTFSSEDISVTLNHPYGKATATVDMVEQTTKYQILNVWIPFLMELILAILFIIWMLLVFVIKPKYNKYGRLYMGRIAYNSATNNHKLFGGEFTVVELKEYNRLFPFSNGRWEFTSKAKPVEAGVLQIQAMAGDDVYCHNAMPWYKGKVKPVDMEYDDIHRPEQLMDLFGRNIRSIEIQEIEFNRGINSEDEKYLAAACERNPDYLVIPTKVAVVEDRSVIKEGTIFIYTIAGE